MADLESTGNSQFTGPRAPLAGYEKPTRADESNTVSSDGGNADHKTVAERGKTPKNSNAIH